jgi:hypothetical protein
MNTQCDEDDYVRDSNCGQPVIVDSAFFESAISMDYELVSFDINDDCLNIEVSSSGCDGVTWSMVLVDSGEVEELTPNQRHLKFVFTNEEDCLTVLNQSRIFNLTALRVDGVNEVILNIEGFPEVLNYMYP